MDKEILRVVIIAVGAVVILGMILWSFLKSRKKRRGRSFFRRVDEIDGYDEKLRLKTENDDFDVVPLGSAFDDDYGVDPIFAGSEDESGEYQDEDDVDESESETMAIPPLIQFSIVARADEGFNGLDLFEAFERVGLEYGSMKVFERVDANRLVDFAVASMVEPGTFPDDGLEDFYSPGIVFFMQPREVDNPSAVFDDFIHTIDILASELDGVRWDHQRQPLTEETIETFREILA